MQNDGHYITITLKSAQEQNDVLQTATSFLNNLEIPNDWNLQGVIVQSGSTFPQGTQTQQRQTETVMN